MRANLRTSIVAIAAAIMAVACSARQTDTTAPGLLGERPIAGTWAHGGIGPVYRELMTLAQDGNHVTGTGTYAIEAGREGPTTIDGTLSGRTLTLTITRDYGVRETFTGTLTNPAHLVGALVIESSEQAFDYAKQ